MARLLLRVKKSGPVGIEIRRIIRLRKKPGRNAVKDAFLHASEHKR
jgi:hypothetical protein